MSHIYPMLLKPALHTRVWGGRRLETELGKVLPTSDPYGESWELHDSARIANGVYAGRTLGEVLAELGAALVGERFNPAEGFPLLAKLLDAADWLSVQVHPNDAQAAQLEGDPRGKTEAWLILAADAGARLVIGVQHGTTREQFAQAIRENTLENRLVYADVKAGDVLYIPAGTVHAIGPGLLIYEIQQSSDVTYRLYDWGRLGLDGQPRTLHIEKGVAVANIGTLPTVQSTSPSHDIPIIDGEYFVTYWHALTDESLTLDTHGQHFHALTVTEGALTIQSGDSTVMLFKGQSVLIPSTLRRYTLSGTGQVIRSLPR